MVRGQNFVKVNVGLLNKKDFNTLKWNLGKIKSGYHFVSPKADFRISKNKTGSYNVHANKPMLAWVMFHGMSEKKLKGLM